MDIQYLHNFSTFNDIYKHLKEVSPFFLPPLEERVDIEEYANKLFKYAQREEAYYDGELVGLVAYYCTEGEKEAFISNVSVQQCFSHKGIATLLLNNTKNYLCKINVHKVKMEVANDKNIIEFYRKNDFYLDREIDYTKFMMVSYLDCPKPLVSIICLVFNHKAYIRQCLDGFIMQKVDFPIEVLIHDDASTDGSKKILCEYEEKYPKLFKPIYQTINQYSKGIPVSYTYQYPRCLGKYVAVCEGDDYWTDPLKLQKQVNILESDKNIGFVYSKFQLVNLDNMLIENSSTVSNQLSHSKTGYLLPSLLRNNFPQTLTVMFKKELLANFDKYYSYGYDWPLFIHICGKCKSVFLKDVTGCYRINPNGMMASGTLKDVDNGGFTTLNGAFRAYLCGEYKAASILDKLKINVYMYYRLSKGDIKDSVELENCVKSRLLYQLMRRMTFVWAFLLKKK